MHSCSIASVIPTKRLIGKPHSNRSGKRPSSAGSMRSEEHTSELQSPCNLVCRLLLEKKKFLLNNRLARSRALNMLKARAQQRTDSTHVPPSTRPLNGFERAG